MHFLTEPAFRADAIAVADDQHLNHQYGIDGWAAGMAVVIGQLFAQVAQVKALIDAAQEMILWNVVFKIEAVEQPAHTRSALLPKPTISPTRDFSLATPCQRPPRLHAVFRVVAQRDLAAAQAGDFAHQVEVEATLEKHVMQRHAWRHWRNCGIHSTSRQGRHRPLPRISPRRRPGSGRPPRLDISRRDRPALTRPP